MTKFLAPCKLWITRNICFAGSSAHESHLFCTLLLHTMHINVHLRRHLWPPFETLFLLSLKNISNVNWTVKLCIHYFTNSSLKCFEMGPFLFNRPCHFIKPTHTLTRARAKMQAAKSAFEPMFVVRYYKLLLFLSFKSFD